MSLGFRLQMNLGILTYIYSPKKILCTFHFHALAKKLKNRIFKVRPKSCKTSDAKKKKKEIGITPCIAYYVYARTQWVFQARCCGWFWRFHSNSFRWHRTEITLFCIECQFLWNYPFSRLKKKEGYLKLFGTHFVLQKVLFLSMPPPHPLWKTLYTAPACKLMFFAEKGYSHL